MHSTASESVIVMEFHTTEKCSSLDLTKAKYDKNQFSAVEKNACNTECSMIDETWQQRRADRTFLRDYCALPR
jgi:hypothetical protein